MPPLKPVKERERKALLLLLLLALVTARSPLCLGEAKTGEKSSMDLSVPAGLPYRGVKLVSRKMVGLDDLPITSSESEFTASSGGEDVYELYE